MAVSRKLEVGQTIKAPLVDANNVTVIGFFTARVIKVTVYGGQTSATVRYEDGPNTGMEAFIGPAHLNDPSLIDILGDMGRKLGHST